MSGPREERAGPHHRPEATPRDAGRWFFLGTTPEQGEPRLASEEVHHAAKVLRLRPGERIMGLDGRGRAWPLEIRAISRTEVSLAAVGEPRGEPAPGEPGAAIPDLRVAFSMPRASRLEALVDRLTQIGAARIAPFVAAHTPERARNLGPRGGERLTRIVRSACKQCHRLWEPILEPLRPLAEVARSARGTRAAVLDPRAELRLADWFQGLRRGMDPGCGPGPGAGAVGAITLFIGPEGGFAADDLDAVGECAPARVRVAPYVLRVETAAELAAGVLVHGWR